MSNTNHPANDEEQFGATPTDYRALLAMTRPLIIAEHSLLSWRGGEVWRAGFGISPERGHWRTESNLRRGEIFRWDERGLGTANAGELAMTRDEADTNSAPQTEDAAEPMSALGQSDSNLQIRICLGMS